MEHLSFTVVLAVWGAVVSSGLAGLKVWEAWRDRRRLVIGYSFTGDPDIGNQIIIENPTRTPVMLQYWELYWMKRRGLRWQTVAGRDPDDGDYRVTIGAFDRHVLEFAGRDHFDWSWNSDRGRLLLVLHIVGRSKPLRLNVGSRMAPAWRRWLARLRWRA